jgi:cyclopropane-fatty-acyl-phospholipid synthase
LSLPFDIEAVARGELPDRTLRAIVRFGVAAELRRHAEGGPERQQLRKQALVERLRSSPIAGDEDAANAQHYELPAAFFELFLGKRMKYSAGYWPEGVTDLDGAEQAMLDLVIDRTEIHDGQRILDLGCGWGAFALYAAERFPRARILGVSSSASQRRYVEQHARERGLTNVRVVTASVARWEPSEKFDRIVSVEMFEHMRNYDALLARISRWLAPAGRLFVHVFCHARHAYVFEQSWMADRFFTGGLMPSADLLFYFQRDMVMTRHFVLDGRHYQRTCEAWLERLDARRDEACALLAAAGAPRAPAALAEWRVFLLSCAESFGAGQGSEWMIGHYVMEPRG